MPTTMSTMKVKFLKKSKSARRLATAKASSEKLAKSSYLSFGSSRKLNEAEDSCSTSSSSSSADVCSSERKSSLLSMAGSSRRRLLLKSASFSSSQRSPSKSSKNKSVSYLIKKRRWSELERVLRTEEGRAQLRGEGEGNDAVNDGNGTVLHEACRRFAPLPIIWTICDILLPMSTAADVSASSSSILDVRDRNGRTPLHCYAAASASASCCCSSSCCRGCDDDEDSFEDPTMTAAADAVVAYLLSRHPGCLAEADAVRDKDGRTPLHLACGADDNGPLEEEEEDDDDDDDNNDDDDDDDDMYKDEDDDNLVHPFSDILPMVRSHPPQKKNDPAVLAALVRALIRANPSSVNTEDDLGITPLEYAINSDTPLDVVMAFRNVSVKERKHKDGAEEAESSISSSPCEQSSGRASPSFLRISSQRKVMNGAQAA